MGNRGMHVLALTIIGSSLVIAGCSRPAGAGAHGSSGALQVTHAVAWSAADVKAATIGMEISNGGDATDTLVAVTSPAGAAMLHTEVTGQGMRPVPALPLPPRGSVRIGRGLHVMVENLKDAPATGTTIPLTLRFARGGAIDLSVPVLRYSEALTALGE
jgi:copper(I)-binding protein